VNSRFPTTVAIAIAAVGVLVPTLRRHLIGPALVVLALVAPATAAATGTIAGNVTDPVGDPIEGICVAAHLPGVFAIAAGPAFTDPAGDYELDGLTPGDYEVEFYDESFRCVQGGDFYVSEWLDDAPDQVSADPVTVVDATTTTGIDAVLAEPEAIAGRVTDTAGAPLEGICVVVGYADGSGGSGQPPGFAQTSADGYYFIALPVGQYKVSFYDGGFPCDRDKYEGQFYNDKPGSSSADVVTVVTGRTTFGINAVMWERTRIRGHVQDEAGQPLDGICVVAQFATGLSETGQPPGFARTNPAGDYVMGIASGDYKVSFYDNGIPCNVGKYVGQWFNGKSDLASADVVQVARGATVSGIDATMKLLQLVQPLPTASPPPVVQPAARCRVPKLRGITLRRAKRILRIAHCRLGSVTRKRAKPRLAGRVLSSRPRAGARRPAGTKVRLVIGKR
jgi:hypothetical protein